MKISNETKIGVLTAAAITILVLGLTFLKGKNLFSSKTIINGEFTNIQGLLNSNAVMVNGMQIGAVYGIENSMDMKKIIVKMNLTKEVNIPINSVAYIRPNPLGTTSIEIKLGNATEYLKNNAKIQTDTSASFLDAAMQKLDPVLAEVANTVRALDTVLISLSSIMDPTAKNNIQAMLANLSQTSYSLTASSASLQTLLNTQTGSLAKTLDHVSAFTGNLANNNEKITQVMDNLDKTTTNFAKLDLEKTLASLDNTITELKNSVAKLNNKDGTIGMLLNDTRVYENLASTANKLNLLLDDIRTNPKRYISISVFGKKNNSAPLSVPLPDTLDAPYIIKNVNDQ